MPSAGGLPQGPFGFAGTGRNNYAATSAPTSDDDESVGYRIGSIWVDVTSGNYYACVDKTTGAAVWAQLSGGAGLAAGDTVMAETSFGLPSAAGASSNYSRADHTHGSPADPVPAHEGGGNPHPIYLTGAEHAAIGDTAPHHSKAHDHTAADGSGALTNDEHDGYSAYVRIPHPAAPAAGARLYSAQFGILDQLFYKNNQGQIKGPMGDKATAFEAGKGPAGSIEPPASTAITDGYVGALSPASAWNNAGTELIGQDVGAIGVGRYRNRATGIVSGNDAGWESPQIFSKNLGSSLLVRVQLLSTANIRCFIGFSQSDLAASVGADGVGGTKHAGFQFSTPRGDANWQVTSRGIFGQQLSDSGVAANTDPFYVQLVLASVAQLVIMDRSMTPVYTRNLGLVHIPSGPELLYLVIAIETQVGAAKSLRMYHTAYRSQDA